MNEVRECFRNAKRDEEKDKKHKGLMITVPDNDLAKEYIEKAKKNIGLCDWLKKGNYDYKIPEEWFYTLYYCALAILSKLGVESRNQRCTASFLDYLKNKRLIEYDDEFIKRITVYKDKQLESDVDEREKSRYGSSIKSELAEKSYDEMIELCKKAIAQVSEIVYSDNDLILPQELIDFIISLDQKTHFKKK